MHKHAATQISRAYSTKLSQPCVEDRLTQSSAIGCSYGPAAALASCRLIGSRELARAPRFPSHRRPRRQTRGARAVGIVLARSPRLSIWTKARAASGLPDSFPASSLAAACSVAFLSGIVLAFSFPASVRLVPATRSWRGRAGGGLLRPAAVPTAPFRLDSDARPSSKGLAVSRSTHGAGGCSNKSACRRLTRSRSDVRGSIRSPRGAGTCRPCTDITSSVGMMTSATAHSMAKTQQKPD